MRLFTIGLILGVACTAVAQTTPAPSRVPAGLAANPAPTAAAPDPAKVVLTIGDEKITAAQYDEIVSGLQPQYQTAARGQGKRQFAENLAQLKLMAKEAEKRKLDQKPAVRQQLTFSRDNLLANALFQDIVANTKVDDAAKRKYYEDHKSEFESIKAKHILIRMKGSAVPLGEGKKDLTDEEALAKAQDIRKQLLAGADFTTLAKSESYDTQSGKQGGDLGTFKRGQMVPAFEQAAFALSVGQVSEPIKTQFGYHLIKVDQKDSKTYEQAESEIESRLKPEQARKEAEAYRSTSSVMLDESFFGPPAAPAPSLSAPASAPAPSLK